MILIDINRNPTARQLRQFAAATTIMLPLVTWCWTRGTAPTLIALAVASLLAVVSVVRPATIKPVFVALSLLTWPIGVVISELVLVTLYFLVFTPAGLVSRLLRRDPLMLKPRSDTASTWTSRTRTPDADDYFRMS